MLGLSPVAYELLELIVDDEWFSQGSESVISRKEVDEAARISLCALKRSHGHSRVQNHSFTSENSEIPDRRMGF